MKACTHAHTHVLTYIHTYIHEHYPHAFNVCMYVPVAIDLPGCKVTVPTLIATWSPSTSPGCGASGTPAPPVQHTHTSTHMYVRTYVCTYMYNTLNTLCYVRTFPVLIEHKQQQRCVQAMVHSLASDLRQNYQRWTVVTRQVLCLVYSVLIRCTVCP